MPIRPKFGRSVFYHRDSKGRHEKAPAEYVRWAIGKAAELGLQFDGEPETIQQMRQNGESNRGDIYFDDRISGNILSRQGLDRMLAEALSNTDVTHVLIPRRDRLARPDDLLDAVAIENSLQRAGVTIVYMDSICLPLANGQRADVAGLISSVIDFDRAAKERHDLAQKIIYAQVGLAKQGSSIGGRAPYAFYRCLVKGDGTQVRRLENDERVRMAGHSVIWLPEADDHLHMQTVRRILAMLETMPASRVAATLTAEGVPSPNAGRLRRDGGVLHAVSGVWHQTTITNIARNPLLLGVLEFGRRSMGDRLRFTPKGPRVLQESDYRHDAKPKIIRNEEAAIVRRDAAFKPLVDSDDHHELLDILDARGKSQRGKPRSKDPDANPLGGRVADMNCTWPMYRTPYLNTFVYKCGLYQQSHGTKCSHNHVDGPTATQFALACLRQRVLMPRMREKLCNRLRELAERRSSRTSSYRHSNGQTRRA